MHLRHNDGNAVLLVSLQAHCLTRAVHISNSTFALPKISSFVASNSRRRLLKFVTQHSPHKPRTLADKQVRVRSRNQGWMRASETLKRVSGFKVSSFRFQVPS